MNNSAQKYNRTTIQQLALTDPIVRAAMAARAQNSASYEEMLIVMVVHLSRLASDFRKEGLADARLQCPDPSKHFHSGNSS